MSKPTNHYQFKQIKKDDTLSWWILLAGLLLVPLLIGFMVFPSYSPTLMGALSDTGMKAEVFTTLKWYALLMVTGCSLLWFGIRLVSKTVTIPKGYFPALAGFLFLTAILSLLLSDYKGLALYGNYDMRDGTLSWLCFLLLGFIAASCRFPATCKRPLFIVLTLVLLVNFVMGLCLFLGINLTRYPIFLKFLMLGQEFEFSSAGQIYGTMSNPNYLSALGSALATFFMVYFVKTPRRKAAAWFLIPIFFGFSVVLTSISTSGFATLGACSILLLVVGLLSAASKKEFIGRFALLALLFGGMFGLYSVHNPALLAQTTQDGHKMMQTIASYFQTPVAQAETDYPYPLTDTIVDPHLTLADPISTFGNNRGYIWEETWQLILERPLLGYGMGTLLCYFPYGTQDYFAHRDNVNEVVSKPHNFYLGIAFGSGLPALLALLALFALFFFQERPSLTPPSPGKTVSDDQILKMASWLCCISLMIQFLVNDMMLATSIVFWILFGLCCSIPPETKTVEEKHV